MVQGLPTDAGAPRNRLVDLRAVAAAVAAGLAAGLADFLLLWLAANTANSIGTLCYGLWGVVARFVLGIVLVGFVRWLVFWAVRAARCTRLIWAVVLALVIVLLMVYSVPTGRALGRLIALGLAGELPPSPAEALLTLGAVLTRGGLFELWNGLYDEVFNGLGHVMMVALCALICLPAAFFAARTAVGEQRAVAAGRLSPEPGAARLAYPPAPAAPLPWAALLAVALLPLFALAAFPQQTTVDRFEVPVRYRLGRDHAAAGRADQAIAELRLALRLDPSLAGAHQELAGVYYRQEDYARAEQEYLAALRLDPTLARAHLGLGWTCLLLDVNPERYAEAVQEFTYALHFDPTLAAAHEGLGAVRLGRGEYEEAIADFQMALSLNPDSASTHDYLGWAYYYSGQYQLAVAAFANALALDGENVVAQVGTAWAYYQQDNLAAAERGFRRAIEMDPDWADGYLGLGLTCMEQDKAADAAAAFAQFLELCRSQGCDPAAVAQAQEYLAQLR